VLARLQDVEGVSQAAVDYGGNYVRLTCTAPKALDTAMDVLSELGYEPDVAAPGEITPSKWYDIGSVFELSAVEADVIARRVVGKLTLTPLLARDVADRLQIAVAAALRRCFADRDASPDARPGAFRHDCLEAAAEAARASLDDVRVAAFVHTLEADLNEDHTHDAGL
jgi:hypothetical protein